MKPFFNKYLTRRNRNILSIGIIVFGMLFIYNYSYNKPTYINKYIATKIYKEPANNAFHDQNFYSCVIDAYNKENNTSVGYTTDLTSEQLKMVTVLKCSNKSITDLSGIEKLTELVSLQLPYNKFTTLDVSKNTALTSLDVSYNQLTTLDVSKNIALTNLKVNDNQLTSLDVSNNTTLRTLNIYKNQLTSLDVSKNTALTGLEVYNNQLITLDVSKNTALTYLKAYQNQLTSLNTSGATSLINLNVSDNQLSSLNLSNNTTLRTLNIYKNQLTSLDVSKNTALEELYAYANQLTALDVSNNTKLVTLHLNSNKLSSIDVSNNSELTLLSLNFNELTTIDITKNIKLLQLGLSYNSLTSLDATKNTELTLLSVGGNKLTEIDVSKNLALTSLEVHANQLTRLDVRNNKKIEHFAVQENSITTLDISQNVALKELWAYSNKLVDLDLSKNPALTLLSIEKNQLASLDLSNNKSLETLNVSENQLISLKVNGAVALTELYASTNKLTNIDVSKNTKLKYLSINNNKLTKLDASNNLALVRIGANNNQLTTLDVSKNIKLKSLYVEGNQFKEIIYIYKNAQLNILDNAIKLPSGKNNTITEIETSNDNLVVNENIITSNVPGKYSINNIKMNHNIQQSSNAYTLDIDLYVIEATSDKYIIDDENSIIFTINDIDSDTIISNINLNYGTGSVDDNKYIIKYDDKIIKEFTLANVTSNKYDLSKGYIYYKADDINNIKNNITCNNCTLDIDRHMNSMLLIKHNDSTLYFYNLVGISSDKYDLSMDYIYYNDDNLINDITCTNCNLNINNNKLEIKRDNDVIDTYDLVSLTSNKYEIGNSYIYYGFDTIDNLNNNLTCNNCTFNIDGNKLIVKYNEESLKEYTLLGLSAEYMVRNNTINVSGDYGNNELILSKIDKGLCVLSIENDKLIVKYNNEVIREYNLSNNNDYIEVSEYVQNNDNNIISKIDPNITVNDLLAKIDTNGIISILDKENNIVNNDSKVCTGYTLRAIFAEDTENPLDYKLSVRGDVFGTGEISVNNAKQIAKHIINKNAISGDEYLLAADYDGDGLIKMNDVIKMLTDMR